jgi:hypothetical protein
MEYLLIFWLVGAIINYFFWKWDNRQNLLASGIQFSILLFSLLLSWIFLIMQIAFIQYNNNLKRNNR